MGWIELGRIPGYALTKDGSYDETLFMWKQRSVTDFRKPG